MIGGNKMEQLMKLLKEFRDDVDFENCKDLVDGKVFDSFEILQLVDEIDDEFDVIIVHEDLDHEVHKLGELLPYSFGPEHLNK